MPAPGPAPEPRRIATIIWAAQLGGCVVFFAIAAWLRTTTGFGAEAPSPILDWIALAFPVGLAALSFTVPAALRPPAGASPEAFARTRLVVGWALREGAALLGTVVWMLSGDPKPLAGFAIGVAALAASLPTGERWRAAVEAAGGAAGRPPMVR